MARTLLSVIVFISVVHCTSSSTATVSPSPTTVASASAGNNQTTPGANSSTAAVVATQTATLSVAASSGNATTALSTSQIAPTTSGNVPTSSSVPSKATKTFKATVKVDAVYDPDYNNLTSETSRDFIGTFTTNVSSYLNERLSGDITIKVTNLTNGSVVVDFNVVAPQSSNASVDNIKMVLEDGNTTGSLLYKLIGDIAVQEVLKPSPSVSPTATVNPSKSAPVTKASTAPPTTSTTKGTEIWDKAIDMATPMGTFIIVIVAVALLIVLLIALICVCCKYRSLKKRTHFPDHMAINDSEWIRSSDDLLMWERNLRASEVKTANGHGISNRPINDKRA